MIIFKKTPSLLRPFDVAAGRSVVKQSKTSRLEAVCFLRFFFPFGLLSPFALATRCRPITAITFADHMCSVSSGWQLKMGRRVGRPPAQTLCLASGLLTLTTLTRDPEAALLSTDGW